MKWVKPPIRVELRKSSGVWVGLSVIIPGIAIALLLIFFRDESGNVAFISNYILGIVASSALPLAIWRGIVAEEQADTAQQGLRNERYQNGAEMLGSDVLSVRMGGIYALQRLAEEHPEEYHIQIMRLLCAFVRRPTADKGYEDAIQANLKIESNDVIKGPLAREDVQEVMRVIGKRTENQIALERKQGFWFDLSRASLRHIHLRCANLTGANFSSADLFDASLISVDLTKVWFGGANLSKANLYDAVLFESILVQAKVSGTIFIGAQGLRQNQLDQARRLDPGEAPPMLDEVLNAVSGEQLKWKDWE